MQPAGPSSLIIGINLSGSLDEDHSYDLTYVPGQDPKATVSKNRASKAEVLDVQFDGFAPTDKTLAGAATVFFGNSPFHVSPHRSVTHLLSKVVEIKKGEVKLTRPVSAKICVSGNEKGEGFRLLLDPSEIGKSQGWLNNNHVVVDMGDLKSMQKTELLQMLPKLSTELIVQVVKGEGAKKSLKLTLKKAQAVASSSAAAIKPSPKLPVIELSAPAPLKRAAPPANISLLDVHNVSSLVEMLRCSSTPDSMVYRIAQGMVNKFTSETHPSEAKLQEIKILLGQMTAHDGFRILNTLMSIYQDAALNDEVLLSILTDILVDFQRKYYQRILNESRNEAEMNSSNTIFETLDCAHLVKMMGVLTVHLTHAHEQGRDSSLVCKQLATSIALLDVMTIRNVKKVEESIHTAAYDAIARFEDSKNYEARSLANYGKQAFRSITNDVTNTRSFFNRTFLVLQAAGKVADAISLVEPWHIGAVFEAWEPLKQAYKHQEFGSNWFKHLFYLRELVFRRDPQYFLNLLAKIKSDYPTVAKEIDFREPSLIYGFIDLLWEILHFPHFPEKDLEMKKAALDALSMIYVYNIDENKTVPFNLENEKMRQQLQTRILRYVWSCVGTEKSNNGHSQVDVKQHASLVKVALQPLAKTEPKEVPAFTPIDQFTELFDEAVKKFAPLLQALQTIRQAQLNDPQLRKEKPYFIDLDAKDDDYSPAGPLFKKVLDFLNGPYHSLFVEGDGGAGKSLSFKVFVELLMEAYTQQGYFPVYVHLPSLIDPIHNLIHDTLQDMFLDAEQIKQFVQKNVVWICDAWDEINSGVKGRNDENIYIRNHFDKHPNWKCVFIAKRGTAQDDRFLPGGSETLQKLILAAFDPNKIKEYVQKCVKQRKEDCAKDPSLPPLPWPEEFYLKCFEEFKQDSILYMAITNPFLLKIAMEVLPIILEQLRVEKKNPNLSVNEMFQEINDIKVIRSYLFEAFAVISALRSSRKTHRSGAVVKPEIFLEFGAQVARVMDRYQVNSIPCDLDEDPNDPEQIKKLKSEIRSLFNPNLAAQTLVIRKEGQKDVWTFIHNDYRVFLTVLGQDPRQLRRVVNNIEKYNFAIIYGNDN